MSRFRNFIFTWNNPPEDAITKLQEHDEISFCAVQRERGESTGTEHLQGYIELRKQMRGSLLCKWFPWYIDKRKGTSDQAFQYSTKDETRIEGPWVWGERRNQGNRTDIEACYSDIKAGKSKLEIAENHTKIDAKYHKALDRVRRIFEEQSSRTFRHLQVHVYWGLAGTGKTRKAVESSSDYFILNQSDANTIWWDGYEGQSTLIIDDFTGWIRYRLLLKILDGYQLRLSIKGGFTYARWTTVYITSNKDPKEWYVAKGMTPELKRRISSVTRFQGSL